MAPSSSRPRDEIGEIIANLVILGFLAFRVDFVGCGDDRRIDRRVHRRSVGPSSQHARIILAVMLAKGGVQLAAAQT
jgi:hypothetical protein